MTRRFNQKPSSKAVLPFKWQEHFSEFLKLLPEFVVAIVDKNHYNADPQYFVHFKVADLIKPCRLSIIPGSISAAAPLVLSTMCKEMETLVECFEKMAVDCRKSLLEIARLQEKPLEGLGGGDNGGADKAGGRSPEEEQSSTGESGS